MFEYINLISLILSLILISVFYTISIQPMKRSEKHGEKAWKECRNLRAISTIFLLTAAINSFLWIWYPIPSLSWKVSDEPIISIIISIIIVIPCLTIMILGEIAAGKESLVPSKETEMYGGIYNYIRHPQTIGEFPLYIALGFFINSWFIIGISSLYCLIYIPIMVHFEEEDLVKRFGDSYKEYQKRTGAVFPNLKLILKKER